MGFSWQVDLKRHERTRTEEKQHGCSKCEMSFTNACELYTHKRTCKARAAVAKVRRKAQSDTDHGVQQGNFQHEVLGPIADKHEETLTCLASLQHSSERTDESHFHHNECGHW